VTTWLSALIWATGASWAITLGLMAYLDLRVHALMQSGDLPKSTPQLMGFSWGLGIRPIIAMCRALYSRRYRETDGHTRLLVPIVRIGVPLSPILALAIGIVR
jgi:hypothetical protein